MKAISRNRRGALILVLVLILAMGYILGPDKEEKKHEKAECKPLTGRENVLYKLIRCDDLKKP